MVAIVTIRMGDIGHGSLHVMVDGRRSEVGTYPTSSLGTST